MIQIRKSLLTTLVLVILIFTAALTTITTTINSYAQTGTMATLQNIQATYAVSIIPGAAQRDSPYHYYPPAIAIPTGTTIAWINNDMGQPDTVTSGSPSASDAGSVFNQELCQQLQIHSFSIHSTKQEISFIIVRFIHGELQQYQ
jgi:plastocyanin